MYEQKTNAADIVTNIIVGALVIGTAAIVIAGAVEAIRDRNKPADDEAVSCPDYCDVE